MKIMQLKIKFLIKIMILSKRKKELLNFHLPLYMKMKFTVFGLIIQNGKIYVSTDYNKNTPYLFSFTLRDHTPNTLMISSIRNYSNWKNFIENFKMGNVYYENQKIKHVTNNLLKMVLSLK